MSAHQIRRVIVWTELFDALQKDYPDVDISDKAGPAVTQFIENVLRDSDYKSL